MNKYKKLIIDFVTILFGNFGSKFLSFLMMPLYTSILTENEYGISDLITTTVSLLYPVFTLGMGETLNRFLLDKDGKQSRYLSISLIVWGIGALIILSFSPILIHFLFDGKYLFDFFGIYCASSLCELLRNYAKGTEKVKIFSVSGIVDTIFIISLNILFLLFFKIGLRGLLLSTQIANWITCIFLFVSLKLHSTSSVKSQKEESIKKDVKKMIYYGIPLLLNSISWWIVISSDKYVLLFFHNEAFNGIYSVSQKIPSIIVSMVSIFISAWSISSVVDFGSEQSKDFFENILYKTTCIQVVIASILIVFNKSICKVLFHGNFFVAWKYVPILLIANVFYSNVAFLGSIYTASKKTKNSFYTTLIGAIVNIILNFLLAPKYDIYGVCFATLISYFVTMVLRIVDTKKILNINMKIPFFAVLYLLLITEGFISLLEIKYNILITIILSLLIVFICYKEVEDSLKTLFNKFKGIIKKS